MSMHQDDGKKAQWNKPSSGFLMLLWPAELVPLLAILFYKGRHRG